VGVPGTAIRLGSDNGGQWASNDIDVFHNIVETTGTGTWIDLYRPRVTGFDSQRNLFWNADGSTSHLRLDFNTTTLQSWRSATSQDTTSKHGNPQWIDQPTVNDYYTQPTSPARDSAATVAGESFCGSAPDIGFRESC
jgi:hypothetical protein